MTQENPDYLPSLKDVEKFRLIFDPFSEVIEMVMPDHSTYETDTEKLRRHFKVNGCDEAALDFLWNFYWVEYQMADHRYFAVRAPKDRVQSRISIAGKRTSWRSY